VTGRNPVCHIAGSRLSIADPSTPPSLSSSYFETLGDHVASRVGYGVQSLSFPPRLPSHRPPPSDNLFQKLNDVDSEMYGIPGVSLPTVSRGLVRLETC